MLQSVMNARRRKSDVSQSMPNKLIPWCFSGICGSAAPWATRAWCLRHRPGSAGALLRGELTMPGRAQGRTPGGGQLPVFARLMACETGSRKDRIGSSPHETLSIADRGIDAGMHLRSANHERLRPRVQDIREAHDS
ncbi:hypothetical protein SBBP2_1320030 [Burkholderiales bacterium]|nr:hypothetical protein SBBP2_1320030 [Burkholderiales bacterium]